MLIRESLEKEEYMENKVDLIYCLAKENKKEIEEGFGSSAAKVSAAIPATLHQSFDPFILG